MTKNLRKRHVQCWLALLVLLPAGIIGARLATPVPSTITLLQPNAPATLPIILQTAAKENYTIHIRKGNGGTFQLEWINKNILTVPTATIYSVSPGATDIKNGIFIGRIEAMGTYRFEFPATNKAINPARLQLVLYDFIHQQIIDTITF